MTVPAQPKIYHIVHADRLPSIIEEGFLWCDSKIIQNKLPGTTIGMGSIKTRRLKELMLTSHPELYVGDCVPFYFCPRSIMLYLIYQANHPDLGYRGGQGQIVHLEADLHETVTWAQENNRRWAFSLSNAGAYYFEDRCDLRQLNEINWPAVQSTRWSGNGVSRSITEGKQAEFLMEERFPWQLIKRIGVHSRSVYPDVINAIQACRNRPQVEIKPEWYY